MTRESNKQKKQRAVEILDLLQTYYADAECALHHSSAFELLVATILSAQCTDKRVNQVTLTLFQKYNRPEHFVDLPIEAIEAEIKSTNFYRNKARHIQNCARALLE